MSTIIAVGVRNFNSLACVINITAGICIFAQGGSRAIAFMAPIAMASWTPEDSVDRSVVQRRVEPL
ncbi:MAG TPA: hypothetical protein VGR35_02585 [Tepidisphaeraceae bacterium]|nr:hypothetical protein [Tepidisphaeraceae bacterium]